MKKLEEYTPYELAILATVLGISLTKKLSVNQQNVVGNFLETFGQIILTIAAQNQNLQSLNENQSANNKNSEINKSINFNKKIEGLHKEINELKKHIEHLEDNIK